MSRRILMVVLTAALAGPLLTAQGRDVVGTPTTGTGSIAGRITEDGTGRPINRAIVTLVRPEGGPGHTVLANADGYFVFRNLPAGRYARLNATKPSYVTTFYGAKRPGLYQQGVTIPLQDGQHLAGIDLTMVRGGVVTGTIVDHEGRPVRDARVTLTQISVSGSQRTPISSASALTDDRGMYRAYGLAPGDWIVSANASGFVVARASTRLTTDEEVRWAERTARGGALSSAAAPPPAPPLGPAVTYSPVYYPGTVSAADARIVTLGPGEERTDVSFPLRYVPTARVSGTVTGPGGRPCRRRRAHALPHVTADAVRRLAVLLEMSILGGAQTDASGRFVFEALTPGQYTMQTASRGALATASPTGRGSAPPDLWAQAEITIDGRDVADVALVLQPGMTLRGRVVIAGAATVAPLDLSRVIVSLQPAMTPSRVFGSLPTTTPAADGTFSITGIIPGDYRLWARASSAAGVGAEPAWIARAAVLGGRDVLDIPLTIRAGDALDDIIVTFTDRVAEITGSLVDGAGRPAPELFVFLFSTSRDHWWQGSRRLLQPIRPDTAGRFGTRQLPPGEYYLCALTDFTPADIYNPAFLDQLVSSSIRVTLVEGQKTVQDLRLAGGT